MKNSTLCTLLVSSLFFTACDDRKAPVISNAISSLTQVSSSAASSETNQSSSSQASSSQDGLPLADSWLGKWNGPEGTFIDIAGGNGRYDISIQDLDGAKHYQGTAQGDTIFFERNGTAETLQASNGADTGMKWLAEKSDCLKLRPGEGWCRD